MQREDTFFLSSMLPEENDITNIPEMKERMKLLKACLVGLSFKI